MPAMLKWIKDRIGLNSPTRALAEDSGSMPEVIPRARHQVSRQHIAKNALKVLYRLNDAGYEGYLVGGGVRDLLLNRRPKDFDIATSATPEEVKRLFRNCRLIGRRFRLAHIYYGREIIEVATFRGAHQGDDDSKARIGKEGMILRDNVFGTLYDDAWRRDFRINALYYDVRDFSIIDHTGGMKDLQRQELQIIGDPDERFREDPVRMLRAIRFAAKLGFTIEAECQASILRQQSLLENISPARLFDESSKLFLSGNAETSLDKLLEFNLFAPLYPRTAELIDADATALSFIREAMRSSDERVRKSRPVNPAFLLAVMLWGVLKRDAESQQLQGGQLLQELQFHGDHLLRQQQQSTSAPKRLTMQAREIWVLQQRLIFRKQPFRQLEHPRFRAAYDFLLLRCQQGEIDQEIGDWWTHYQEADDQEQRKMTAALGPQKSRRRRSKGRKGPQKGVE